VQELCHAVKVVSEPKCETEFWTSVLNIQLWYSVIISHNILIPFPLFVGLFVCFWRDGLQWARASSFTKFLDHTQRRTTVSRTALDEWSASRRDLYLTTHDTHNRQISMPPVGFETTISAGERPQTYALDPAATGTGNSFYSILHYSSYFNCIQILISNWIGTNVWNVSVILSFLFIILV